jgi:hypothetical protein
MSLRSKRRVTQSASAAVCVPCAHRRICGAHARQARVHTAFPRRSRLPARGCHSSAWLSCRAERRSSATHAQPSVCSLRRRTLLFQPCPLRGIVSVHPTGLSAAKSAGQTDATHTVRSSLRCQIWANLRFCGVRDAIPRIGRRRRRRKEEGLIGPAPAWSALVVCCTELHRLSSGLSFVLTAHGRRSVAPYASCRRETMSSSSSRKGALSGRVERPAQAPLPFRTQPHSKGNVITDAQNAPMCC